MLKKLIGSMVPAVFWNRICGLRWHFEHSQLLMGSKELGIMPAISMKVSKCKKSFISGNRRLLRRLRLKNYNYPLYYRDNTSDLNVIWQIFGDREYECAANEANVALIVDCGANIGCTSFFLLHRYPKARVVAVEPDLGNFEVCRRNLAPFGDRALVLNAAVWPTKGPLRVLRTGFRDEREWSFRVAPVEGNESPDVLAITVDEIIQVSGQQKIDLLKIDIEGGERLLFYSGYENWLPRTRNLVIELHDRECERTFFNVLDRYKYELSCSGELTYCRNLADK